MEEHEFALGTTRHILERMGVDTLGAWDAQAAEGRQARGLVNRCQDANRPMSKSAIGVNVLAGPRRVWHFHNDPAHAWMLAATG